MSKDKQTQVRWWIEDDLDEFLAEMCEKHERSKSFYLNQCLRSWKRRVERSREKTKHRKAKRG